MDGDETFKVIVGGRVVEEVAVCPKADPAEMFTGHLMRFAKNGGDREVCARGCGHVEQRARRR